MTATISFYNQKQSYHGSRERSVIRTEGAAHAMMDGILKNARLINFDIERQRAAGAAGALAVGAGDTLERSASTAARGDRGRHQEKSYGF